MAAGPRATFALACVLVYAWWSVSEQVLWPSRDARFHVLAEDALLTAYDSVRGAMLSISEAHRNGSRALPKWNTPDLAHLGPIKRLQVSLDNIHRVSPPQVCTRPQDTSSLELVEWIGTADVNLCEVLAGKRITMIGGEHVYSLHLHFLRHQERLQKKPFPCPYHEFCTHHHICLPHPHLGDDARPPRYIKSPTAQELIDTESALVNYIVSDTLLSALNGSFWAYSLPFLDPTTGVRLRETYWLSAARKANVVILGRGPLSAPGPTYAGNWSFLRHRLDHDSRSRAAISGEHKVGDEAFTHCSEPRPLEILDAAVHLTVSRFLPDLFLLLQSIRREIRPNRRKRLIWPGSWYRLPGRGSARAALLNPGVRSEVREPILRTFLHSREPGSSVKDVLTLQLSALLVADATDTTHLEDPWTLLFNAQVYLQSVVLRELLPRYGIVFLPLDVPWTEDAHLYRYGHFHDEADVELERETAIGAAFLSGISYILRYLE